jgi:hypothetical protein
MDRIYKEWRKAKHMTVTCCKACFQKKYTKEIICTGWYKQMKKLYPGVGTKTKKKLTTKTVLNLKDAVLMYLQEIVYHILTSQGYIYNPQHTPTLQRTSKAIAPLLLKCLNTLDMEPVEKIVQDCVKQTSVFVYGLNVKLY